MPGKIDRGWSYLIFAVSCILLGLGLNASNVYAGPSTAAGDTAVANSLLVDSSHTTRPGEQCGLDWRVVPSPDIRTLADIEVISANDIWGGSGAHLVHWNGENWVEALTPPDSRVYELSAIASDDIWAVGYAVHGGTLTLHWDGQSWSRIPSPNGRDTINILTSVSAVSTDDVWAVGESASTPTFQYELLLHWDGNTWSIVPTSQFPNIRRLDKIVAVASDDVWAVGSSGSFTNIQPLIMHWDGSEWEIMATPKVEPNAGLETLYAVSADDVWAGGFYGFGNTLMLHYDGTAWEQVPVPDVGSITDMDLLSPDRVIALGTSVLQWDGSAWSTHSKPDEPLAALAVVAPDDIWAAARPQTSGESINPIRHYTAQLFADVPPNHIFYPFTRCLACRNMGIVSGYSDGTFRPNSDMTRDLFAVMIANAANFTEDPGPQVFEDIAPGTPYYNWVQRLANRGVIGGYPCGAAGEPCGTGNRPYFRPNAIATRGQISKIVSEARGYTDPVSGQTFEDVPPSNSFYTYIERLASRGIMGGYPCGGAGEPCGMGNRPYFHPNTNATRGQASKIVANTFFPGCETSDEQ